jgi:hypothetical protein
MAVIGSTFFSADHHQVNPDMIDPIITNHVMLVLFIGLDPYSNHGTWGCGPSYAVVPFTTCARRVKPRKLDSG